MLYLQEKYGQTEIKLVRVNEKQCTKIANIIADTKYLLICKQNDLRSVFARQKIVVKLDCRTHNKITRQIVEAETHNKHCKKKSLLRQLNKNKKIYI